MKHTKCEWSRDSSASIVTRLWNGWPGSDSRYGKGPTQFHIQWVRGVKWPGYGAEHSAPPSAEVKDEWRHASTLPHVFMAWCLVKHRDNFTFIFTEPGETWMEER
jgi:hypothetical protein